MSYMERTLGRKFIAIAPVPVFRSIFSISLLFESYFIILFIVVSMRIYGDSTGTGFTMSPEETSFLRSSSPLIGLTVHAPGT